jgi:6,7-dimethyl-8-ribityllumazine synthase
MRIAIVVSRFHDFITDRLLAGAEDALRAEGIAADAIDLLRVPGAFEIPLAAQRAAETGRVAGVICLGCLIRGATPHFDILVSSFPRVLPASPPATGVPMAFGVLTTNSVEEALERAAPGDANKGREAAMAALEMARLFATLPDERP